MIAKLSMKLETRYNNSININKSSLFHGILMEHISREYADFLHQSALRPYSQNLYFDKKEKKWVWSISTLNEEAYENIIEPMLNVEAFVIRHNQIKVQIVSKEVYRTSYDDLYEKNYNDESTVSRYIQLEFQTPTTFKYNGRYTNFPNISMMLMGLVRKYDAFSQTTTAYCDDLEEILVESVSVYCYELKSCVQHLEGIKIPAFVGKITLKVNGHISIASFVNTMTDFAEYSGIGVKTAIGMGMVRKSNPK